MVFYYIIFSSSIFAFLLFYSLFYFVYFSNFTLYFILILFIYLSIFLLYKYLSFHDLGNAFVLVWRLGDEETLLVREEVYATINSSIYRSIYLFIYLLIHLFSFFYYFFLSSITYFFIYLLHYFLIFSFFFQNLQGGGRATVPKKTSNFELNSMTRTYVYLSSKLFFLVRMCIQLFFRFSLIFLKYFRADFIIKVRCTFFSFFFSPSECNLVVPECSSISPTMSRNVLFRPQCPGMIFSFALTLFFTYHLKSDTFPLNIS